MAKTTSRGRFPFLHIGLTGGIASGKSTVAALLQAHGAEILDADVLARQVVEPGQPAHRAIVETFGPGVVHPDGSLDRRALAAVIFADPIRRAELEAIVHPAVRAAARERLERLARLPAERRPRAVVEVIPLLYEVGLAEEFDEVWVVGCELARQIDRMQRRDGLDLEEAQARLAAQLPLEHKIERADRVIVNDGDRPELEGNVMAIARAAGLF